MPASLDTPLTASQALKEWDAQVRALAEGRTALLVRKGGIVEARGEFEVEHREFLLYPTFLHQNGGELRPDFAPALRDDPNPGTVSLPAFARVVRVWKIEHLPAARALEPFQALTASAIERRFAYRGKPWVHALLLEVFALPEPARLEETPGYAGCVSWVPLDREVSLAGMRSVLPPSALESTRRALEGLLGRGT